MPFIVATYVYASRQGQRTHSARTNIFTILQRNILLPICCLRSILVDEVISQLFEEDEEAQDFLDGIHEFEVEALFCIEDDSDLDDNSDDDDNIIEM